MKRQIDLLSSQTFTISTTAVVPGTKCFEAADIEEHYGGPKSERMMFKTSTQSLSKHQEDLQPSVSSSRCVRLIHSRTSCQFVVPPMQAQLW